jgi:hypothetical protein
MGIDDNSLAIASNRASRTYLDAAVAATASGTPVRADTFLITGKTRFLELAYQLSQSGCRKRLFKRIVSRCHITLRQIRYANEGLSRQIKHQIEVF